MDTKPWQLGTVIYNKYGTTITETVDREWVVKMTTDLKRIRYELRTLITMNSGTPRHRVLLPPPTIRYYDYLEAGGWYVMKRYSGEVAPNEFCKTHWRTMAIHVLQFLQDLHHVHGLVHMDIKKSNIFYDQERIEFVVADYELAEPPNPTRNHEYNDNYKWYYMAMGAELDKQLASWRIDLVALGYLLGSLFVDPANWTFEKICWDCRLGRGLLGDEELLALRDKELAGVAAVEPQIAAYLDRLNAIPWDLRHPPPRSFYEELEAIFNSD
jgi:serine/threonine protein kinase